MQRGRLFDPTPRHMLYDMLIMPRIRRGWVPNVNEQTYDPFAYVFPLMEM